MENLEGIMHRCGQHGRGEHVLLDLALLLLPCR
jgi:hypothetical protein